MKSFSANPVIHSSHFLRYAHDSFLTSSGHHTHYLYNNRSILFSTFRNQSQRPAPLSFLLNVKHFTHLLKRLYPPRAESISNLQIFLSFTPKINTVISRLSKNLTARISCPSTLQLYELSLTENVARFSPSRIIRPQNSLSPQHYPDTIPLDSSLTEAPLLQGARACSHMRDLFCASR